jgi:PKD repeat protein
VRWGLVFAAALLSIAPSASAARTQVTVEATPATGQAPLTVAFTATGAVAARWDFGDGTSADGVTVEHLYAAGRWTASVTSQSSDGSSSTQSLPITAYGLTLNGPRAAPYGRRVLFRGTLVPAERGVRVAVKGVGGTLGSAKTRASGSYVLRTTVRRPGTYVAVSEHASSTPVRVRVVLPRLTFGRRGAAVALLGAQLRRLHYAAPSGATFDGRMLDAVYAFQKVQGLPRTGAVGARFWGAIASPRLARPRYVRPANHLEIDKHHQVLLVISGARVALIVPISTAGLAGTFTPVGRFAVYRKVAGFDPSPLGTLYDPMYFTGGYAIHGNPSVPPYPASHGCVRVPMWIAPHLFATTPYGQTVYVY